MAKVTVDNLQSAIDDILKEYGDEVNENMDEIVKRVAKTGVQALKNESKSNFGGSGKYARGWTSQVDKLRYGTMVTIYNRTPGLPHLLEYGHAMRNGDRVSGRSHIAPVEEELIRDFTEGIERKL